ncbi:valine--pyruvate transaminase [Oleiphilus messinensis]|uniref:Valine--pyruvate transaminase n=1 Tax=Oleiphilus messinensis TaxID=141451 RepID=A0A1Y0IAW7_9GAMM|nr:valine--pyruvate transaminase [Oleiphilus messinensis]ARU57648.1 valine--pyruvate transaminase [Oleiphilus messinensis]
MKLSKFGTKFTSDAGITSLMDDLGNAMASGEDIIMMGGGNPGFIPEVESALRERLQRICDDPTLFRKLVGVYDPPLGDTAFIKSLAKLLNNTLGWPVSEKNIGLTNGSQSAFFMLFNMFAGEYEGGAEGAIKQIQLPMTPEYIGYADAGLTEAFFRSNRPTIELLDDQLFKYHVDFEHLTIPESTGALCISRPTNPTGNVITDQELTRLDGLAREHGVPLILDCAYGLPFPGLIFSDASSYWNDNMIVCLSLSKLGLPACRTGIVIAHEDVINALAGVNAILNLATGSFGAMLAADLVDSGQILALSDNVVRPEYLRKSQAAVARLQKGLSGLPFRIHKPEGAMFLWLWFDGLPISSHELYECLKKKGVLIVSGHYFFPGLDEDWSHKRECIRITYSQDESLVARGLDIIIAEVRKIYSRA